MDFNYERETLNAYKDQDTARSYFESYEQATGLKAYRFKVVAEGERAAVRELLAMVPAESILDIPCGTGKLAPVFAAKQYRIVASDISPQMMEFARAAYARAGCSKVEFEVADASALPEAFKGAFDLVVCLRLMHRVPPQVGETILKEFAGCARYTIVSFGINSMFHRVRRRMRNLLVGGGVSDLCTEPLSRIRESVSRQFRILAEKRVHPIFSEEVLFLLERR